MSQTRRLAAILAADVAGYSRLIGADEGGTLQALKAIRAERIDPTIAAEKLTPRPYRGSAIPLGRPGPPIGRLYSISWRSSRQRPPADVLRQM